MFGIDLVCWFFLGGVRPEKAAVWNLWAGLLCSYKACFIKHPTLFVDVCCRVCHLSQMSRKEEKISIEVMWRGGKS